MMLLDSTTGLRAAHCTPAPNAAPVTLFAIVLNSKVSELTLSNFTPPMPPAGAPLLTIMLFLSVAWPPAIDTPPPAFPEIVERLIVAVLLLVTTPPPLFPDTVEWSTATEHDAASTPCPEQPSIVRSC